VVYRVSLGKLPSLIREGRLPGYRLRKRWYVLPPEVAFKGVIDDYQRRAARMMPVVGTRELAEILGISANALELRVRHGTFPRGEVSKNRSAMYWSVDAIRKALRKLEGRKENKEKYSPTIAAFAQRELAKPEPAESEDVMDKLRAILALPPVERQKQLQEFYRGL